MQQPDQRLRDWQHDFGGFTKVYESEMDAHRQRRCSYVIRQEPTRQMLVSVSLSHCVLSSESSARGRRCMTCPARMGNSRIRPRCLCENWRHASCSYQSHLGRACPSQVRILGPKRKLIITSHPYLENYVLLPTRDIVRTSRTSLSQEQYVHLTLARQLPQKITVRRPTSDDVTTMSCINVLEFWEDGGKLIRDVAANAFNFPTIELMLSPWTMPATSSPELCGPTFSFWISLLYLLQGFLLGRT